MRERQKELLLELRSKLIGEKNTMPYCIYTDETIEDLLDAQPKTLEELVQVKGFPQNGKRVKGFGEAILAIFNNTKKVESLSVDVSGKEPVIGYQLRRISAFD